MKVLLIKDVYKLGHAGDIKKVANGYGRNYLIPQGLAVLATPGALKQADRIRAEANTRRISLNKELSGLAGRIEGLRLTFASKAGETGKLYGSITNQMIAEAIAKKIGDEIDRRQVETEPIRTLGEHVAHVRLTVDLVPQVTVFVHREGEVVQVKEEPLPAAAAETEAPAPESEDLEPAEESLEEPTGEDVEEQTE